ncbi:MAG TPA: tetratricopeptide repeat protein [Polyangiaceae bacterium]|nr:tetratricopeptide repeat protein [Polyangiaceae bacterium]
MAEGHDEFTPVESERPTGSGFDGEDFLFHLYRGSELLQDNCVPEAKEELERALAMQPRDVEGQGLLGVVYFRLGLYPRAIQIYEDIIRACPREVSPRVNLALCYLKTGQSVQARDVLEEVIRLVPEHRRAWGYLGLVYERTGDAAKAVTAFERAGQPHMVRRVEQQLEQSEKVLAASVQERDALRQAAADAVQELDDEDPAGGFLAIQSSDATRAPELGHWRATEPGEEPMPLVQPLRAPSLVGRFGPAVPSLAESLAPPSVRPFLQPRPASPSELAGVLKLPFPEQPGVRVSDNLGLVRISQGFVARVDALRVLLPEAANYRFAGVQRRTRGRELDEPLGGLSGPLIRVEGSGTLLLTASKQRTLVAATLNDEFMYVREYQLVGFEASLRHENGRLSAPGGDHVPMVQLAGRGGLLVETRGVLRALDVRAERPVVVRGDQVLGWTGRLLPNPLGANESPAGMSGFIGFSGDGSVFLELDPS